MGVILLKLAGPLQSWGSDSRFTERKTRHEPTKSGVVGLLAAALGRRRTEDVSDLSRLIMAARIDHPGRFERDFQTAHTRKYDKERHCWVSDASMPLSNRYYLADAAFVVGLEGDSSLLSECAYALDHPQFPLYLGRRSCPPAGRIFLVYEEHGNLLQMMGEWPWEASTRIQKRCVDATKRLELIRDHLPEDPESLMTEVVRDVPISFSQEHRQYSWRTIVHDSVEVPNPYAIPEHDPLAAVEGAQS